MAKVKYIFNCEALLKVLCVILIAIPSSLFSQTNIGTFGQNRVQYHDFVWSYYRSDNFNIYYYQGGQDLGKAVVLLAEENLDYVAEKLEFRYDKIIDIIVYTDVSDRNQTNIGYNTSPNLNDGGQTKIIDNKIIVYFNGDHEFLQQQVREGLARLYMEKMMMGSNFQEVLQNAVLLNLPDWFTDGLVEYIKQDWNTVLDNELKQKVLSGSFEKLNRLTDEEKKLFGHSFWHYVEMNYGEEAIPNLLYVARTNRSMESGFMYIMGMNLNQAINSWFEYYYNRYRSEVANRNLPDKDLLIEKKNKKGHHYYQATVDPKADHIAYITDDLGKWKIHLIDLKEDKKSVIKKGGFKTVSLVTDYSYPLIAFDPTGKNLTIIWEKRDKIKMTQYDLESGEKTTRDLPKFQRIFSLNYAGDKNTLLLSAMQKGQVDIFTMNIRSTKTTKITDDYFDDIDPVWVTQGDYSGILFSSNRTHSRLGKEPIDTILPGIQYDLYFFSYALSGGDGLLRVTNTSYANEKQPDNYSDGNFSFLSDENGINNRRLGYFDNVFSHFNTQVVYENTTTFRVDSLELESGEIIDSFIDMSNHQVKRRYNIAVYRDTAFHFAASDYPVSILEQEQAAKNDQVLEVFGNEFGFDYYLIPVDTNLTESSSADPENSKYRRHIKNQMLLEEANEEKPTLSDSSNVRLDESYQVDSTEPEGPPAFLQTDFDFGYNTFPIDTSGVVIMDDEEPFEYGRVRPYKVKFATDELVAQLDNNLLMTSYQKFNPQSPVFNNPELRLMFKLGVTDLFEDHKIIGGFRVPVDFNSSEFFISYFNLKKRLDKSFTFYRSSERQTFSDRVPYYDIRIPAIAGNGTGTIDANVRTNYAEIALTYPLDVLNSVRTTLAFRNDKYVFKSQEAFSLLLPTYSENWLFARAEFVHDQTLPITEYISEGMKFKVFAEFHKEIPAEQDTIFGDVILNLPQFNDAYMVVWGFDFRHYQKVHRNIIWANRVSYSTSVGNRKLMYYLGGVDGWIGPSFDNTTPINTDNNYAFQTIATNMRGFKQNARNGNSYFLINSELRVPIFSYFIKTPIRSDFIRNFQIVGFTDIGTAWEGANPFDEDNPAFSEEITQGPVTVLIKYARNPVIAGYGTGIRTSIFGYYFRMDVAWGKDSGISQGPMFHFSLNKDF